MLSIIFRGHDEAGFFAHAVGLGAGTSPVKILPGNARTHDARYACVIVVQDYVRLKAPPGEAGGWHYSLLEPDILADVRDGRAILVFDLSNEGPAYDADIFSELYAWIETNRLPAGRCIWLGQNRLMAAAAAADMGSRAALLQFADYDYFVKLMAWKFSLVDSGGSFGLDPDEYLERLLDVTRKDKLLLCLNATPRLARILTVAALHHHQLMHRSLVSFPGMQYVKSGASLEETLAFVDAHPILESLRPWVHAVGRMAPLRVDDFTEQGNALVETLDPLVYARSFFSLVTESDFFERNIARVPEKTVKAFSMGHPSLVLGNPHSIDIMRDLGFQDWNMVFDRSADSIEDPTERFDHVFADVARQTQCIKSQPTAWMEAVRDVSLFNHRYAVSGDFLRHYVDTFDRRLVATMTALVTA
jgi:hypothetical protein